MKQSSSRAFRQVPHSARGHFILNFYAAVYRLVNHIRRLSEMGGEELETIFEEYPFLAHYFGEMLEYMPNKLAWEEALDWWEQEIAAWEQASDEHLPLLALTEQGKVDFRSRIALLIVGLVEEDSRFGTLFAKLQEPLPHRRPCLELVGHMMMNEDSKIDPWQICAPLITAGLVNVINEGSPRSEWALRVPAMVWDAARGEVTPHPTAQCQYHPPESFPHIDDLIFPQAFLDRLTQVPALLRDGQVQAIILRGTQGSNRLETIGSIARKLGRGVLTVDGELSGEQRLDRIGPFCTMTRALPALALDLAPGETKEIPKIAGYEGPVGILLGSAGGLGGWVMNKAVTLTLPIPKKMHRMQHWQEALAGHPVEDLTEISERFHLPGGYIRQVASMAIANATLDRKEAIAIAHVQEACRALNRQLLDTLAARVEAEGTWDRLVVNGATMSKLQEVEQRCHHRERLLDHLGPAFGSETNCGVRALFTGASGTGKTLAAKILASELGMDLYRVDLAAIVNKYIGETEKNLHQVLSRAEELDVILLLDEGDALLGNRTQVRSANDRYANLETNYLLQKLEHYQGVVIVTTNAGENIDKAFQRRMDIVVSFIPPEPEERWHIWQIHLPLDHAVDPTWLEEVAIRCAMTGGQIRNAALHATLLAINDRDGTVKRWHVEQATHSEYRKAGATCPLNGNGRGKNQCRDMEAFLDALSF